jgi:hypothetical protein
MKKLSLFVFILGSKIISAQNYLTNVQVFNFSIGDTIQSIQSTTNGQSGHMITTIITGKAVFGSDSISYSRLYMVSTAYPPWSPNYPGSTSTSTDTFTVKNLNSVVTLTCGVPYSFYSDTVYTNSCGYLEMHRAFVSTNTFEPDQWESVAVAGAGNYYFSGYYSQAPSPYGVSNTLQFVSKGGQRCGNYAHPTSIRENEKDKMIEFYPNPNHASFTLTGLAHKSNLAILDIGGKEVYRSDLPVSSETHLDLSSVLGKGFYFMKLYDLENGFVRNGKLIVN